MKSPCRPVARWWRGWLAVALLTAALPAHAHDPMSSFGVLRLRGDGMELTVLLAPVEAKYLLPGVEPAQVVIDEESFPALHDRLRNAASVLYILSVGEHVIAPGESAVVLTPENDVEFRVYFPRPEKGRLRLHAAYLARLSADHVSYLTVLDEKDRLLGGFAPFIDDPDAYVTLPAKVAPTSTPAAAAP